MDEDIQKVVNSEEESETSDLKLLLDCIKYHQDDLTSQEQALKAIATQCYNSDHASNYLVNSHSLTYVLKMIFDKSLPNFLKIASLHVLCAVCENNAIAKDVLCDENVFVVIKKFLTTKSDVMLQTLSCYFFICLVKNNENAQLLSRRSRCIETLRFLFKDVCSPCSSPQYPNRLSFCRAADSETNTELVNLWQTVANALSVSVNNPQNCDNQVFCSSVFPVAVAYLRNSQSSLIQTTTMNFITNCLANNNRAQISFRLVGGLRVLCDLLTDELSTGNQVPSTLLNTLVLTLQAAVYGNQSCRDSVADLEVIPLLLQCLQLIYGPAKFKVECLMTIGACIEECANNCEAFASNEGINLVINLMAENQNCEELQKSATCVLHTYMNQTKSLSPKVVKETSSTKANLDNSSSKFCLPTSEENTRPIMSREPHDMYHKDGGATQCLSTNNVDNDEMSVQESCSSSNKNDEESNEVQDQISDLTKEVRHLKELFTNKKDTSSSVTNSVYECLLTIINNISGNENKDENYINVKEQQTVMDQSGDDVWPEYDTSTIAPVLNISRPSDTTSTEIHLNTQRKSNHDMESNQNSYMIPIEHLESSNFHLKPSHHSVLREKLQNTITTVATLNKRPETSVIETVQHSKLSKQGEKTTPVQFPDKRPVMSVDKVHQTMENNTMATNTMATDTMATNTMVTNTMATNTMVTNTTATNNMVTNTMATNTMATNTMTTNTMATNTMTTNTMATNTMVTNTMVINMEERIPDINIEPCLTFEAVGSSKSLQDISTTTRDVPYNETPIKQTTVSNNIKPRKAEKVKKNQSCTYRRSLELPVDNNEELSDGNGGEISEYSDEEIKESDDTHTDNEMMSYKTPVASRSPNFHGNLWKKKNRNKMPFTKCLGCRFDINKVNSHSLLSSLRTNIYTCSKHRDYVIQLTTAIRRYKKFRKTKKRSPDFEFQQSPKVNVRCSDSPYEILKKVKGTGGQKRSTTTKKHFSDNEIETLRQGVQRYGPHWSVIQRNCRFSSHRSAKTLKQKFKNLIKEKQPRQKRPFTCQEEENLKEGVLKYGYNWTKIINFYQFQESRTAQNLKDKWRNMVKNF